MGIALFVFILFLSLGLQSHRDIISKESGRQASEQSSKMTGSARLLRGAAHCSCSYPQGSGLTAGDVIRRGRSAILVCEARGEGARDDGNRALLSTWVGGPSMFSSSSDPRHRQTADDAAWTSCFALQLCKGAAGQLLHRPGVGTSRPAWGTAIRPNIVVSAPVQSHSRQSAMMMVWGCMSADPLGSVATLDLRIRVLGPHLGASSTRSACGHFG